MGKYWNKNQANAFDPRTACEKVSICGELFSVFFQDTLAQSECSFYLLLHSLNKCLWSTTNLCDSILDLRTLKTGETQSHSSNGSHPSMETAGVMSGVVEVKVT